MVKTLALGRVPRPGGGGLKLQIGSFTTTVSAGTAGSFPLFMKTVRHLETRTLVYSVGSILQAFPMGSTKGNYGFVKLVKLGSTHGGGGAITPGTTHGAATAATSISFLALGE